MVLAYVLTIVSLLVGHAGACVNEMDCSLNVIVIAFLLRANTLFHLELSSIRFVRRGIVILELVYAIPAGAGTIVAS